MFEARVQAGPFDLAAEHRRLASALAPAVGAVVDFVGYVRDAPLELEHYPAMAERQLVEILATARRRWPLLGAVAIHRYGRLAAGEPIVLTVTAAAHRAAAFAAAEFLMDWLKTRAPFWKKESFADGGEAWVDAREADDLAAARWGALPAP